VGRPSRHHLAAALAAFCALGASAGPPVLAGIVEVQVRLPLPQKIDVTGMRRILVGGFRGSDDPTIDVDVEYVAYLRELLKKRSTFEIILSDSPPLPEQELDDIIANAAYWRRLGQRFTADLIIGGVVDWERSDRSGFIAEDFINPVSGQRSRRTRYAEREGFKLATTLYFFRGADGALLYEAKLTEEAVFEGRGNDPLTALHQLSERSSPEVLGVLLPRQKTETRYLFME
jgi:hypothetical protein